MKNQETSNKNLLKIWDETISALSHKLSLPVIEGALKTSKAKVIQNNILTVIVENKIAKELLERNSTRELIETTVSSLAGDKITLKFIISPDYKPGNTDIIILKEASNGRTENKNKLNLKNKYTFSNFIIGESNSIAVTACQSAAEFPGKSYNPLFIYGKAGLGKTHLLQAIAHKSLRLNSGINVKYISSETFVNNLIISIQNNKREQFRTRYRNVDILLIDDIQFLINKDATQVEFFHTFNHLHLSDKQIVISSDRHPKEIPTLEDRLKSRFEWGLLADIKPPEPETREAILRKKAELENISVPEDVIKYVAKNIPSNIREMEGALVRIILYASLKKQNITLTIAEKALNGIIKMQPQITLPAIIKETAKYFSIQEKDLISKNRKRQITLPRQIAMFLSRDLLKSSFPEIGDMFGGRDHTTVMHACNKIKNIKDPLIKAHINKIKNHFNSPIK